MEVLDNMFEDLTFDDIISEEDKTDPGDESDGGDDLQETQEEKKEEVSDKRKVLQKEDKESEDDEGEEKRDEGDEGDKEGESVPLVEEVISKLGIRDRLDEGFTPEDSVDGLIQLVRTSAEVFADDIIDQFFETHPTLGKFAQYLLDGGDESTFVDVILNRQIDFDNITIDEKDVLSQERIVIEHLRKQGHAKEDIDAAISDYKENGLLFNQSNLALKVLSKAQKEEKERLLSEQQEKAERLKQEQLSLINNIKETITQASDFNGIVILESDKRGFLDYITKIDPDTNTTKRNEDLSKLELKDRLLFDYLMYKDFKISDFISSKAKTIAAEGLRNRLKKHDAESEDASDKSSSIKKKKYSENVNLDDFDISQVF